MRGLLDTIDDLLGTLWSARRAAQRDDLTHLVELFDKIYRIAEETHYELDNKEWARLQKDAQAQ